MVDPIFFTLFHTWHDFEPLEVANTPLCLPTPSYTTEVIKRDQTSTVSIFYYGCSLIVCSYFHTVGLCCRTKIDRLLNVGSSERVLSMLGNKDVKGVGIELHRLHRHDRCCCQFVLGDVLGLQCYLMKAFSTNNIIIIHRSTKIKAL